MFIESSTAILIMISVSNIVTAKFVFTCYFYLMLQVKVCLRYDRSLYQRKNFIQEAEMAASLNHENILRLHGVVLAGLYTESVALVCIFILSLLFSSHFASQTTWNDQEKKINIIEEA